jgi:uncharacterized protein YegL
MPKAKERAKAPKRTSRKQDARGSAKATADILVAFAIDMSGSMTGCWSSAIEGFNDYLRDLKSDTEGETFFSLMAFDTVFEQWHIGEPVADVPYLDNKRYVPRGGTALYDAIANTVLSAEEKLKEIGRAEGPDAMKVLVVTLTDGMENSSLEYSARNGGQGRLAQMIKAYEDKGNWTFVYLGTNQDAHAVGTAMGYSPGSTAHYTSDKASLDSVSQALSSVTHTHKRSALTGTAEPFAEAGLAQNFDTPGSAQAVPEPPKANEKPVTESSLTDFLGK